jgi:hypothetical protein
MTKPTQANNDGTYWTYNTIEFGVNIIDFTKPVIIDLYNNYDQVARCELQVAKVHELTYNSTVPHITISEAGLYSWGWNKNTSSNLSYITFEVKHGDITDNNLKNALYNVNKVKIYYHPVNALSPQVYSEY